MIESKRRSGAVRALLVSAVMAASLLTTGCVSGLYVDTATKEVPIAQMKKPAQAKPATVVFEFQTKGAPNAAATKQLQDEVLSYVAETGLFAQPAASASAMLNITINNIPLTDDAVSKGFVTGLTFGLAGSAVTDGYVCTVTYLAPGQGAPVVKTARHAVHATIGNASPPPGAGKPLEAALAYKTMAREVISNALRDLALDPAFH